MRVEKQLSVFLVNKPGRLAAVCSALAKRKINIAAMTIVDSTEHGVLRIVVDRPRDAREVLEKVTGHVEETDVLLLEMPNRPGAMASVLEKLADAHVNINYSYVSTGAPGGKTTGVFKVSELAKAMKVLGEERKQERNSGGMRRPPQRV